LTRTARAVFILLVGATVAAFFTAQRLKGEPAVAKVRSLVHVFSPNGDHFKDINRFYVELRERAEVSVDVVDASDDAVRRLADDATVSPQKPLQLRWDGRTDDGKIVPDGRYRVRVTLRRQGRSVTVPRTTLVDTRPPRPRVRAVKPGSIIGPVAGPVQIEVGSVSRRLSKRARIYRVDGGSPRVVAELPLVTDTRTLEWNGQVDGKPAPPGIYLVQVIARDRAGNEGTAPAKVPPERGQARGKPSITVRAIAAEPPVRPVTAGKRVAVNVDARGKAYRWRLRRLGQTRPVKQGRAKPGQHQIQFTAPPGDSGLYLLELAAGAHTTSVPVIVQSTTRARMLVVLPTMTWLGTEEVDEDSDGLINDFATGEPVTWPRVQPGALPANLLDDVAPLLRFLDRARVRYDLTSDLDVALSRSPRASDRTGVLLAGSERWIPRAYARRLRQYVTDGGRLASFGTDALRRGVTLRANESGTAGRLLRPTQPVPADAFGTRLQPLRHTSEPVTLTLIGGEPDYGLLTGFDGELGGFSDLEESDPPNGDRGRLLAALGVETATEQDTSELPPPQRPALAATQIGDGVYIRVGLPAWTHRLGDRQVGQITLNVADILRKLPTRIHTIPRGG
jgi:N,N-dimethylformamidase beta subunit-like, C-terminal/FlgD Ig-like domain